LPKQATPWYQLGSGGVDLSTYTGKINIAFKYTGSGKNLALDGAFQVDDVQVLVSRGFKIRILLLCDSFLPEICKF
jgi:hypothetical protein